MKNPLKSKKEGELINKTLSKAIEIHEVFDSRQEADRVVFVKPVDMLKAGKRSLASISKEDCSVLKFDDNFVYIETEKDSIVIPHSNIAYICK